MRRFDVVGMSCAACVARVEQAVSKVPGVTTCSVSLLTNSMGIEGTASNNDIIQAVEKAGYNASIKDESEDARERTDQDILEDKETPILIKRLVVSCVFLFVLMYIAMGHDMLGLKIPAFLEKNVVALGIMEMILAAIVMLVNQKFFVSGFRSTIHLSPNMDTLVAMGSFVSFAYSVWTLFKMTSIQATDGIEAAMHLKHDLYFESAAMILTLITVGKTLEARAKGKTTDALKKLLLLTPKSAVVIRDGKEETIPVEQVRIGDLFVVKSGESIPVDGIVKKGSGTINEAAITGESIPVDKLEGDKVIAATINQVGYLECEATRVGKDTTFSQMIEMVRDAAATKAPIAKIADKVAGVFVPCVLVIAVLTFVIWILVGASVGDALSFGIAVLVISCPCSLGLATPVAIMVGNGVGAKNGILYKTSEALENIGKIDIVVFDKTGTITKGEPKVVDVISFSDLTEQGLIELAYSLERKSEHPLAKAIVEKAEKEQLSYEEVDDFCVKPGKGLMAKMNGCQYYAGNVANIEDKIQITADVQQQLVHLSKEGKTPILFAKEEAVLGVIAVADVIKEDAKEAIRELKNMGTHVVMLTGDNERTAKAIADEVSVDQVVAGVLPDGKEEVIKKLKTYGSVAMVGDGINDALALTTADVGVAIASGTDIAIDSAGVVLMKDSLKSVSAAIRLGRATLKNIKENLFWAFFYNSVGIPIAAGVFVSTLGLRLNPMMGSLAMGLSSFFVVTNALRLNKLKIYETKRDKNRKKSFSDVEISIENKKNKEEKYMKKTMKIEGMMCPHCEARVKGVLEALDGVTEAVVSHEAGTAVISYEGELSDDTLKAVIEKENYTVTGIEA